MWFARWAVCRCGDRDPCCDLKGDQSIELRSAHRYRWQCHWWVITCRDDNLVVLLRYKHDNVPRASEVDDPPVDNSVSVELSVGASKQEPPSVVSMQ